MVTVANDMNLHPEFRNTGALTRHGILNLLFAEVINPYSAVSIPFVFCTETEGGGLAYFAYTLDVVCHSGVAVSPDPSMLYDV